MGLFNNLIGDPLNQEAVDQINVRSKILSNMNGRSNTDVAFLGNNESWIKLSSLIDIKPDSRISKVVKRSKDALAKEWVLFGGTPFHAGRGMRPGLFAYAAGYTNNTVGEYGYKPMPGITSIEISTVGVMGSLRTATVNIRANSLEQLDVLDLLYFRLGYSCLLEWGHTQFKKTASGPLVSITDIKFPDPFKLGVKKEDLLKGISKARTSSCGNYDGFLGLITNYSYQSTPDGGFNCTVKLTGIGSTIDSTKINCISAFPESDMLKAVQVLNAQAAATPLPTTAFSVGGGFTAAATTPPAPPPPGPLLQSSFDSAESYRNFLNGKAYPASAIEAFLIDLKFQSIATKSSPPPTRIPAPAIPQNTGPNQPYVYAPPSSLISDYYFNPGLGLWPSLAANPSTDKVAADAFTYGFAPAALLDAGSVPGVDFDSLSNVFVLPIPDLSGRGLMGNLLTAPRPTGQYTYIKLGFLLAYLNNSCLLYEYNGTADKNKRPTVYINFNPETNFCYTNPQQLSINPGVCIIPVHDSDSEYLQVLEVNKVASSIKESPLFTPSTTDINSGLLPGYLTSDPYKAKVMEIYVNIDYLLEVLEKHASSNGELNVYLSAFLSEVMGDIATSLGNVNEFNIHYDDDSNTISIVDNQLVGSKQNIFNAIPVQGLTSVAKSFSMNTETSTKLGSMLAINAQDPREQTATANADGSAFAQMNSGLTDRLMERKTTSAGGSPQTTSQDNTGVIEIANAYNKFLYQFYARASINRAVDEANRGAAANYYLGAMNLIKSKLVENNTGVRTSVTANGIMPISTNITMAGLSNLKLYEAFMLPSSVLPAQYKDKSGVPVVAFVINRLNHAISPEGWTTTLSGAMMNIPTDVQIAQSVIKPQIKQTIPTVTRRAKKGLAAGCVRLQNDPAFHSALVDVASYLGVLPEWLYTVMNAESGCNPAAKNTAGSGATGLIQFMPSTAPGLGTSVEALSRMSAIEQLPYVKKYFAPKKGKYRNVQDLYMYTFFPIAVGRPLDWVIQSTNLTAQHISKQNPAIARAAGKAPGAPLTVADFYAYVDSINLS